MIDGRGEPRVTDFGLAALASAVEGAEIRNGTPAYMARNNLKDARFRREATFMRWGLCSTRCSLGKAPHESNYALGVDEAAIGIHNNESVDIGSRSGPSGGSSDSGMFTTRSKTAPGLRTGCCSPAAGGDPLAMALAAGQTPSPEMVAASGTTGALQPKVALAILVGIFLTLAVGMGLANYMSFTNKLPLQNPPDVLTAQARANPNMRPKSAVDADASILPGGSIGVGPGRGRDAVAGDGCRSRILRSRVDGAGGPSGRNHDARGCCCGAVGIELPDRESYATGATGGSRIEGPGVDPRIGLRRASCGFGRWFPVRRFASEPSIFIDDGQGNLDQVAGGAAFAHHVLVSPKPSTARGAEQ